MTELQLKEFNLLKEFVSICEKSGLKYYLVCGTALGAVKYGGFIPWDDDVDVALPRKDYEIFIRNAPSMLPENIFLQNYKSDPKFPQIFSKLRDSNTTYIEKSAAKLPINHGVFIDIFPLDGYPEKEWKKKIFEIRKTIYKRLLSVPFEPDRKWKRLIMFPFRLFGIHKKSSEIAASYESMITRYDAEKSDILCNHGNWQGKLEYSPSLHYGNGIQANFEGLKVIIPEKYDDYLTKKYGNWRKDPPAEEQIGHHFFEVCDLNKSYTYYAKSKQKEG